MRYTLIITVIVIMTTGCIKDDQAGTSFPDTKTYVDLNERLPYWGQQDGINLFPLRIQEPIDNKTTEEGIAFGRALFYEPLLSADGTQSCASCHLQAYGFTDNKQFSTGIDGIEGDKNAMQIINLGLGKLQNRFFWDGRSKSLEEQALEPVINPIEMHNTWSNVVDVLNSIPQYIEMCKKAFGTGTIDSIKVAKAIAQFERSLISGNSKYDRYLADPVKNPLTFAEREGQKLFVKDRETDGNGGLIQAGADCFHCHGQENDFSDGLFHNNGLDLIPDSGRAKVTGNPDDIGKFKTPTLRNLKYTAPYMHDGRFKTLDEVIDFYSEGLHAFSINIDPLMKNKDIGGVRLTPEQKSQLKAFLLTLTDEDFVNNPDFSDPHK